MRRAIFLDRDGVLNEVVMRPGGVVGSPRSMSEFILVPGSVDLVARLRAAGYLVFVVTNQPDIERGLLDPAVLGSISAVLRDEVGVDEVVVCTHDDSAECPCRKPRPGMLMDLAERWNVDLTSSYIIGDSWRDMDAGRAAGCQTVLVRRPYNEGVTADFVVDGLHEVSGHLLREG